MENVEDESSKATLGARMASIELLSDYDLAWILSHNWNMNTLLVCTRWYNVTITTLSYKTCLQYYSFLTSEFSDKKCYNIVLSNFYKKSRRQLAPLIYSINEHYHAGGAYINGVSLVWIIRTRYAIKSVIYLCISKFSIQMDINLTDAKSEHIQTTSKSALKKFLNRFSIKYEVSIDDFISKLELASELYGNQLID